MITCFYIISIATAVCILLSVWLTAVNFSKIPERGLYYEDVNAPKQPKKKRKVSMMMRLITLAIVTEIGISVNCFMDEKISKFWILIPVLMCLGYVIVLKVVGLFLMVSATSNKSQKEK